MATAFARLAFAGLGVVLAGANTEARLRGTPVAAAAAPDPAAPLSEAELRLRLAELSSENARLREQLALLATPPRASPLNFAAVPRAPGAAVRLREVWSRQQLEAAGYTFRGNATNVSSHVGLPASRRLRDEEVSGNSSGNATGNVTQDLPDRWWWCDVDGKSYCTPNRNQHIPQYCGSCWAFSALTALADRIKIQRGGSGIDITLSVQAIMACVNPVSGDEQVFPLESPGSCWGGDPGAVYQFIWSFSRLTNGTMGVPYETAQPYIACSEVPDWQRDLYNGTVIEQQGLCKNFQSSCSHMDWARTCVHGGGCAGLSNYPNATVADYGAIEGADAMMREIYHRGPIACGIDAIPLENYTGGVLAGAGDQINHAIEVAGWGTDRVEGNYWYVRNSWGEYWGEMGWARVKFGSLRIEEECVWAVPGAFTTLEHPSRPCVDTGLNCQPAFQSLVSTLM